MDYGKHKFEVGMALYFIGYDYWEIQTEPTAVKVTRCQLDDDGKMSYFYGSGTKIRPSDVNHAIFYDEARAKNHITLRLEQKAREDAAWKRLEDLTAENDAKAKAMKPDYVGKDVMVKDIFRTSPGHDVVWVHTAIKDIWGYNHDIQFSVTGNGQRYALRHEGRCWHFMTDAEKEAERKAKEEAEAKAKADEEKRKAQAVEWQRKNDIDAAEKKLACAKGNYKNALASVRGFRAELKEAEKALEGLKK